MPLCPASGSVLANTMMQSATAPNVTQALVPSIT